MSQVRSWKTITDAELTVRWDEAKQLYGTLGFTFLISNRRIPFSLLAKLLNELGEEGKFSTKAEHYFYYMMVRKTNCTFDELLTFFRKHINDGVCPVEILSMWTYLTLEQIQILEQEFTISYENVAIYNTTIPMDTMLHDPRFSPCVSALAQNPRAYLGWVIRKLDIDKLSETDLETLLCQCHDFFRWSDDQRLYERISASKHLKECLELNPYNVDST